MQSLQHFFESTQEQDLPFVVYRKPGEAHIQAFVQQDTALHFATTCKEEGFVFAPFDTQKEIVLFPKHMVSSFSLTNSSVQESASTVASLATDKEKIAHCSLVQKGMDAILEGTMEKVVLSRKQNLSLSNPNPHITLQRLLDTYPTAFVYYWYHPKIGMWLGATPETLLTIKNGQLATMALAGTQEYKGTTTVSWGEKEKREQALVTQAITRNVNPLLKEPFTIEGPHTARAGNLLHLKTELRAPVDLATAALKEIIHALHPTPAICGLPRAAAQQFIQHNEGYDRAYYTGFLGELNLKTTTLRSRSGRNTENNAYRSVKTSTSLFVNLRCMQWLENTASIYIGGGITSESIPEKEWEETAHKLSTMSSIL